MTKARSEITLKFSELPQAQPAPNKKVEIKLTDQNSIVFIAQLKHHVSSLFRLACFTRMVD